MLAVGNDAQFARFCAAAGSPELASDSRYRTNGAASPIAPNWCRGGRLPARAYDP